MYDPPVAACDCFTLKRRYEEAVEARCGHQSNVRVQSRGRTTPRHYRGNIASLLFLSI